MMAVCNVRIVLLRRFETSVDLLYFVGVNSICGMQHLSWQPHAASGQI